MSVCFQLPCRWKNLSTFCEYMKDWSRSWTILGCTTITLLVCQNLSCIEGSAMRMYLGGEQPHTSQYNHSPASIHSLYYSNIVGIGEGKSYLTQRGAILAETLPLTVGILILAECTVWWFSWVSWTLKILRFWSELQIQYLRAGCILFFRRS